MAARDERNLPHAFLKANRAFVPRRGLRTGAPWIVARQRRGRGWLERRAREIAQPYARAHRDAEVVIFVVRHQVETLDVKLVLSQHGQVLAEFRVVAQKARELIVEFGGRARDRRGGDCGSLGSGGWKFASRLSDTVSCAAKT